MDLCRSLTPHGGSSFFPRWTIRESWTALAWVWKAIYKDQKAWLGHRDSRMADTWMMHSTIVVSRQGLKIERDKNASYGDRTPKSHPIGRTGIHIERRTAWAHAASLRRKHVGVQSVGIRYG
jgi:hypothetical protein